MTQLVLDTSAFFRLAGGGNLDTLAQLGYKFWTTKTIRREVEDASHYKNAFDAKEWIDKHSGGALEVVDDVREFGELTGRDRGEISIENYIAKKGEPNKSDFKIIIEDKKGASRLAGVADQSKVVSVLDFYSRQVLEGKWSYGFALSEINKAITYGHKYSAEGKTGFIAPTSVNPDGANIFGSGAVGLSGSSEWKAGSSDYPVKVTGHQIGTIHFPGNSESPISYDLRGGRFRIPPTWGPAAIVEVKPDGNVVVRSKASAFMNSNGVQTFLGESIQTIAPDGRIWGQETPESPRIRLNSIDKLDLDGGTRHASNVISDGSALYPIHYDGGAHVRNIPSADDNFQNVLMDTLRATRNEVAVSQAGIVGEREERAEEESYAGRYAREGLDSLRGKLRATNDRVTKTAAAASYPSARLPHWKAYAVGKSVSFADPRLLLSSSGLRGQARHLGGIGDAARGTDSVGGDHDQRSITVQVTTPVKQSDIDAAVRRAMPTQANYQKDWNGGTLGGALNP